MIEVLFWPTVAALCVVLAWSLLVLNRMTRRTSHWYRAAIIGTGFGAGNGLCAMAHGWMPDLPSMALIISMAFMLVIDRRRHRRHPAWLLHGGGS